MERPKCINSRPGTEGPGYSRCVPTGRIFAVGRAHTPPASLTRLHAPRTWVYLTLASVLLGFFPLAAPGLAQSASPQAPAVSLKAGLQALFAGDYARAETAAKQQLRISPRSADAYVLQARAEMAQGKYPLAFNSLRKALTYSPSHIDALFFMGKLTSALSQMEYQRLAGAAPDSARVHQLKGDHYQAAGDVEKALEEYKAALTLDPDLTDVALESAEMLRTRGRFEEALKSYSQILARNPRHFPSLYGTGLCYQALQQEDKSIEYFERAVGADPRDAVARYALGAAFMRGGQAERAVEPLTTAVRLDPTLSGAYNLLGRALQMTGQPELAAQAFERARQLLDQEVKARQEKLKKAQDAAIKK